MTTIRQQIRDRIITELNTDRPGNVPAATKRRYLPGEPIVDPRLAVFFTEEGAQLPHGRNSVLTKRGLHVSIQCTDAVADPADADDAGEAMGAWVVSVMGDTNLNGLALWCEEVVTRWAVGQMDRVYVQVTIVIMVNYQTKRDDAEAKN